MKKIESADFLELRDDGDDEFSGRRAVSCGEPSLSGSIDEERKALSDSEIANALKIEELACQVKGPSSSALEKDCFYEQMTAMSENNNLDAVKSIQPEPEVDLDGWIDVLGNRSLMRKILNKGTGKHPKVGDWVVINSKCLNNRDVDTFNNYRFVLGFHFVIEAWDTIIQLMEEGEKCYVKSDARFAYGELGFCDKVAPNQSQEYEIELVEVGENFSNSAVDLFSTDILSLLYNIKERGNFLYRRNEIDKALFLYQTGAHLITRNEPDNVVLCRLDSNDLRTLVAQFYANISACFIKAEEWEKVIECTNKSLHFDQSSTKVWHRQADALLRKKNYDEALKCVENAIAIDPSSEFSKKRSSFIRRLIEHERAKEKRVYRRMFDSLKSDDSKKTKMPNQIFDNVYSIRRWLIVAVFVVLFAWLIHFTRQWLFSF